MPNTTTSPEKENIESSTGINKPPELDATVEGYVLEEASDPGLDENGKPRVLPSEPPPRL